MSAQFPLQYVEPLFRPPSEARSLIFQVINGSSWNRCTYCDMYTNPQKKFRPRAEAEVLGKDKENMLAQIETAIEYFQNHPGFVRGSCEY